MLNGRKTRIRAIRERYYRSLILQSSALDLAPQHFARMRYELSLIEKVGDLTFQPPVEVLPQTKRAPPNPATQSPWTEMKAGDAACPGLHLKRLHHCFTQIFGAKAQSEAFHLIRVAGAPGTEELQQRKQELLRERKEQAEAARRAREQEEAQKRMKEQEQKKLRQQQEQRRTHDRGADLGYFAAL